MTAPSTPYLLQSLATDSFIAGAKVSASGTAAINLYPQGVASDWLVCYVVGTLSSGLTASSAGAAQLSLYTDSVAQPNLWDLSSTGLGVGVVGWYLPPRRLKSYQILVAQFTGGNANDWAQVRVEYALDSQRR